MLERTKKRPIEEAREFTVSCPAGVYAAALDFLRNLGCTIENEAEENLAVPAASPGTHLRGLRYREDLTQAQLAEKAGIPRRHISEMENDKRPIGKKNAKMLADLFQTDPRLFFSA